jgi:proline racemase
MQFSVDAVDAHVSGQHGRVVVGGTGVLAAPGSTMFEKMRHFEEDADWFRRLMLREPRGHPRACVNLLLPPTDPRADAGFVIMEQSSRYAVMSGTNLIVVATVLLETGLVPMREPETTLLLEVPAGLVEARATCRDGRVLLVEFENVPSFAAAVDVPVEVAGIGTVPVSVAWGGMACAVVGAEALGVRIVPEEARAVQELIAAVCDAAGEQIGFRHPERGELTAIEAAVVTAPAHDPANHVRQTTGLPGGQMDTSPSGTGTSATMAVRHARGELRAGDEFRAEGFLDGVFRCAVVRETTVGGRPAIVPRIGARAFVTGYARYVLADDDPLPQGFVLGDIWPSAIVGSVAERLSSRQRDVGQSGA